jgi:hypothetical protein
MPIDNYDLPIMNEATNSFRFRVSLRMLFGLVAVVAFCLGIYCWGERTNRQRREMLTFLNEQRCGLAIVSNDGSVTKIAEIGLKENKIIPDGELIRPGNKSYQLPWFCEDTRVNIIQVSDQITPRCRQAIEFFPEADVYVRKDN